MRTIALALAVVAVGYVAWETRGVTHPAAVLLGSTRTVPAPAREVGYVARDLLARATGLSHDQRGALGELARDWEREEATLDRRLQAAREEFEQFMTAAQQKGRISVAEIQSTSAVLRDISAEMRERRTMHSEASMNVLTAVQRESIRRGAAPASGGSR
jgi:hypothetical protein